MSVGAGILTTVELALVYICVCVCVCVRVCVLGGYCHDNHIHDSAAKNGGQYEIILGTVRQGLVEVER